MFKGLTKFLFSDIDIQSSLLHLTAKQKINLTDITQRIIVRKQKELMGTYYFRLITPWEP